MEESEKSFQEEHYVRSFGGIDLNCQKESNNSWNEKSMQRAIVEE